MEINCLPIEIMFLVFNYLDFKNQLFAKSVCRLWRQLICQMFGQQKYLLIHDTNHHRIQDRCGNFNIYSLCHYRQNTPMITLKSFKSYNIMKTEEYIRGILSNFKNLKVIYLCLFNVKDNQIYLLNWISSSCDSNLKHLSIIVRKSVRLTYREINPFCQKFPNLKVLQFEALDLVVCRYGLNFLLEALPKLEVFIVMDAIHSYERSFHIVENDNYPVNLKDISQMIRVLKVSGNMMSLPAIEEMSPLKLLSNLHICDFGGLQTVQLISEKFTNLSSLTLSNTFNLHLQSEANCLMESIAKLSQLKKLHLFVETENRIFTYDSFSKLKECPKLTILQIESTTLNSHCIEAICRFVPQLKKLDLTYVELENDSDICISWIDSLRHLQCLKLSAIPEIKERSVNEIIKRCTQLEYLDFSRSDQLSDLTFVACIEAAKSRPNKKLTAYFPHRNKNFIQSIMFSSAGKTIPKNLVLKFPTVKYI